MNGKPKLKYSSQKNWGKGKVFGILILLIVISTISYIFYYKSTLVVSDLDPNTLCDKNTDVSSVVAILIDTTDSMYPRTAAQVNIYLKNFIATLPKNTEISVYGINNNQLNLLTPLLKLCKPDDGSHASELVSNPEYIKKQFREKFFVPIEQKIHDLTTGVQSDHSPIIEAIQSVNIESFVSHPNVKNKKLIVVSDLLQNSQNYSFYKEIPSFHNYVEQNEKTGEGVINLSGVEVSLLVIPRKVKLGSRADVIEFWRKFLIHNHAEQGSNMEPLS